MHTPSRWLPSTYATWDDLLTAAVSKALSDATRPPTSPNGATASSAPSTSNTPSTASRRSFSASSVFPSGTGLQPQSGDDVTVKQVGRTFGPSERFTADLSDLDHSTLNLVLGESSNPASPGSWTSGPPGITAPPTPCPSAIPPSTPPPPTP